MARVTITFEDAPDGKVKVVSDPSFEQMMNTKGGLMARHKDTNWQIPDKPDNWHQASVAVLMDLRDQLQSIRRGIDSITNFFHALGTTRCRLIVQEEGFRASKQRSDRLRKKKQQ